MAHIRRHPNKPDSWQVRYRDPVTRKELSKTFARKPEAENFLVTTEADKLRGEWIDPRRAATPFEEWAARWLESRSNLKPKTLVGYESLLNVHVLRRFGKSRLQDIETIAVEEWVADLEASGLSPSRIRQAHQVLNAILKAAVRSRYLPRNPAEGVALPRQGHREMHFLNADQVDALAAAAPARYETLIYVLAYGGSASARQRLSEGEESTYSVLVSR